MVFHRTADWTISVTDAYRSGETIKAITARFGPSFGTIQRELLRSGVPLRRHGTTLKPLSVQLPTSLAVLGYVAGLFDGEGCIYWRRRTDRGLSVRCTIYSTTPELIDWLKAVLGGRTGWDHSRVRRKGWKPIGRWEVSRTNDVAAFLGALRPFLIIKASKADDVLAELAKPRT